MTKYVALSLAPYARTVCVALHRQIPICETIICSVIDLTSAKTPDLMVWLEKKLGKEITTRTWKTVERILKAMS